MYDLLIKGGRIIDGSGGASWIGDVGIRGKRIVALGELEGEACARSVTRELGPKTK